MERDEVLDRLAGWLAAPQSLEFCDALCDAAEYLGWDEGEYSYEELREAVESC